MKKTYDMSVSCFQLFFVSSLEQLMKTMYNLYENNFISFYVLL